MKRALHRISALSAAHRHQSGYGRPLTFAAAARRCFRRRVNAPVIDHDLTLAETLRPSHSL
jgi:hypothetical protein